MPKTDASLTPDTLAFKNIFFGNLTSLNVAPDFSLRKDVLIFSGASIHHEVLIFEIVGPKNRLRLPSKGLRHLLYWGFIVMKI